MPSASFAGGSLVDMLPFMFQLENRPDFSKWHVFYVDERLAPHSSPDSNHGAAKKAFLDRAGIPGEGDVHVREVRLLATPSL